MRMWRSGGAAALALLALLPASANAAAGELEVRVLSNRADLISGGDALVGIGLPEVAPGPLRISLRWREGGAERSRNITGAFADRPSGGFQALVRRLPLGKSRIVATAGELRDSIRIDNHPNGGPIFSGPHIEPWVCQDSAVDRDCNQPVSYGFFYLPEDGPSLVPYDRSSPPDDVATTTTDRGVIVPFIVRVETGYQDRDQYKIATLWQPGQGWKPWKAQEQWNHKLLITHGQGCGVTYGAGSAPAVFGPLQPGIPGIDELLAASGTDDVGLTALGMGFAVAGTALDRNSHNCNIALQAESLVMMKENLVETYGPIRYTIATGCSGGSVTQQQVANAYPGVYQGLTPQCSYPDTFSPGTQFADYHMLRHYFENPSEWGPGIAWLPTQWAAVEGHLSHVNAIIADEGLFKSAIDPAHDCGGVTEEELFNPETNPDGVRCDVLSYMINVLGPRPRSDWTSFERMLGHGLAGVPFSNVGVQYGLGALKSGAIGPAQFADLNAAIGGLSLNFQPTKRRLEADFGALRNAYRAGAFNGANNLENVAIINLGGPDPGAAHDYSHAWWMRTRLEREQGHLGNYVMWFGPYPIIGGIDFRAEAFLAVDRWLTAVERDKRSIPLESKIIEDRPADVRDRCEIVPGIDTSGGLCETPLVQTRLGTPRTVAGGGIASDVGACRLRPLRRTDYYPINFTGDQWAQLEEAFPHGVCDWSEPGIGQRDTIAWLSYGDRRNGAAIHGGRRLGHAPRGSGGGWTSPAFARWRSE